MTAYPTDASGVSDALADSYRIGREVGRGGMACVYRAEDVRHHRQVAIKVIHPDLSAMLGAERFLREIEVTAALQHPHILPLFDSGSVDGRLYYVMPFVEGESLRDRLDRERQLSIDEAIRIASDVASALDYAHRHAVVHRDIKPENILIHDGSALVADFGIALAVRHAGGERITQSGLSVGTPQYMSPEQAAADRAIDARTDIYSLGAVLYEMLTGEPPFTGPSAQAILAKTVLDTPAPPSKQRSTVPPALDALVLRALAKLPADRFASAGEMVAALRGISLGSGPSPLIAPPRSARLERGRSVVLGVLLFAGGVSVGQAVRHLRSASSDADTRRFSIVLPDSSPLSFTRPSPDIAGFGLRSFCITPDGRRVIYVARRGTTTQLYSRRTDEFAATPLAGTDGALMPFASPDGHWVGFVVDNELRKLALETGQVVPLARVSAPLGATWSADGVILVADRSGASLVSVPAGGGKPTTLLARTALAFGPPALLPDSRHVLHSRNRHLLITDLESKEDRVLAPEGTLPLAQMPSDAFIGTMPRYVVPGYLTFVDREGSLMVAPFDASSLRVTGAAVRVFAHVRRESEVGAQYDIAGDGTLVYVDGGNAQDGVLVTATPSGRVDTLPIAPADFEGFAFSPDGRRIAAKVIAPTGLFELWVYDARSGRATRAATLVDRLTLPVWTPDSRSLVYGAGLQSPAVLEIDAEHGGSPDTLYRGLFIPSGFSPDGTVLAGIGFPASGPRGELLRMDVRNVPQPITSGAALGEWYPVFSPDGRWIAFQRQTKGPADLVVVPYPALAPPRIVSSDGGVEAQWSSKGNALYYRQGRQWMAVPVTPGAPWPFGTPRLFVEGDFADFSGRSYGVAADGDRLLLKLGSEPPTVTSMRVVTQWLSGVRALSAK